MKDPQRFLLLDYETFSEAPLRNKEGVGSYEYARHQSTEILCVGYRIGTRETLRTAPIKTWSPYFEKKVPWDFMGALEDHTVKKIAHNALFEQVLTQFVLPKYSRAFRPEACRDPKHWVCTAALASVLALPRKLEQVCIALNLSTKKNMDGHRKMLKLSQPRNPSKHNPSTRHDKEEDLLEVIQYCADDIAAETELFLYLPPLTPKERKIWELDQKINLRGIRIDRQLVLATMKMIEIETQNLKDEVYDITNGEVESVTQVARMKDWLNAEYSINPPNLQAKTLEDLLKTEMHPNARRLIEIRQSLGKVSVKKYPAMEQRSRTDSYVRDILMYHGASTGRWVGAGLQVQNMSSGDRTIDPWEAVEIVRQGDLEFLKMIYGDMMDLFSTCVRSAIIPPEGELFYRGDFSSIEVRVLFWLAGHEDGLDAYRKKTDLYKDVAVKIYGHRSIDQVTKEEREVGKRAILGSGYGMGPDKFQETCEKFGQPVSEKLAKKAIETYRSVHSPVPALWKSLDEVAMRAVRTPGKVFTCGHTKWYTKRDYLWCELPSGRKLAYYKPIVRMDQRVWKGKKYAKPTLFHYGVNSLTKKWELQKTWGGVLTENITQAVARDLLAEAMLRLESKGYKIAMTVHDEILTSKDPAVGSEEEFKSLMKETPTWGQDIPVEVDTWTGKRYKK